MTMRTLVAVLLLLAFVPTTKAQPTQQSVESQFGDHGPDSTDGGQWHGGFRENLRRNYESLSPRASAGQCAAPSSLEQSSTDNDASTDDDDEQKRRNRIQKRRSSGAPMALSLETIDEVSEDGATASVAGTSDTSLQYPTVVSTYVITNLESYSKAPTAQNFQLRKRGHRVFIGQLYKEPTPTVLSAVLNILFPQWVQGTDVDMECHTNQDGRAKGCAWVWVETLKQRDELLAVNKQVLVDVNAGNEFLQLMVTQDLVRLLPHLAESSTPLSTTEDSPLEMIAVDRRNALKVPHTEWLLPNGPMTLELPASMSTRGVPRTRANGAFRQNYLQAPQYAVPALPWRYRHNPYDTMTALTIIA